MVRALVERRFRLWLEPQDDRLANTRNEIAKRIEERYEKGARVMCVKADVYDKDIYTRLPLHGIGCFRNGRTNHEWFSAAMCWQPPKKNYAGLFSIAYFDWRSFLG